MELKCSKFLHSQENKFTDLLKNFIDFFSNE